MHGSRSGSDNGPRAAEDTADETVGPESGAVERAHDSAVPRRFGVGPDEAVEVVVRPESDDFWWTAGLVAVAGWTPIFLTWLVRLGSADPVGSGLLLTTAVMAALMGILMGGMSAVGSARTVATDRGIRVHRKRAGSVLIPWEDVLSIEPTFPYVAEYRIELREGSAALEEVRKPSWLQRIWTRAGKRHRLVGSEQVWDIGSWRLEALQDALDRHAVRAFRSEVERDRGRARLPADDPGVPLVAVPGTVSGAQAPDEEPETPDHDTHRDEDER